MSYRQGGRRRIDRVLDPSFVEGLSALSSDELRSRREDARAEEREISYTRRLLQGRLDLMRADLADRKAGRVPSSNARSDEDLVAALTAALTDEPARSSGAAARHVEVEAPDHEERRRAAEAAVADVRSSDPHSLSEEELAGAVARLEQLEAEASAERRQILTVLDTLTAEIQSRIVEGAMPPDPSLS